MSEAGVLSEDGAGREDPGPAPRKGRGPVSALPADYRPIRPGLAGANGTHWVRAAGAREAPAPRGAVMKMIRLRRRLRRPRPRDAAASARALRAQGRPGPGPDGTGPMGGQDETGPHRGGVRYSSGGAPDLRKKRGTRGTTRALHPPVEEVAGPDHPGGGPDPDPQDGSSDTRRPPAPGPGPTAPRPVRPSPGTGPTGRTFCYVDDFAFRRILGRRPPAPPPPGQAHRQPPVPARVAHPGRRNRVLPSLCRAPVTRYGRH